MNIAMMHFRVGETDGVSLEMDKWKQVLEKNGHKVYYIAGSEGTSTAFVVKELYYRDPYDSVLNKACYETLGDYNEVTLEAAIKEQSRKIKEQFTRLFKELEIDLVVPNNLLCLGRSPHIAMALTDAILETGVDVIGHHHDFYWERDYFKKPTTKYVTKLLETYFPPIELKHMRHVVINTPAKKDLLAKKGLEAIVVPNILDFDLPDWIEDDYNRSYKKDVGIQEHHIVFLQATRVTNRKAIELAIDLIAVMNEPKYRDPMIGQTLYNGKVFKETTELVLVLVGLHEGLEGYEDLLVAHAKAKGVHIIVKPECVDHKRKMVENQKVYSLWDAYVHSDIITYPSIYEGWGNQFLEGLFAKKPQIVFEYSVFLSDIKAYGFDYISLGNSYTVDDRGLAVIARDKLESAAEETINYLTDQDLYSTSVNRNFEIGKKNFSKNALEQLIMPLFMG